MTKHSDIGEGKWTFWNRLQSAYALQALGLETPRILDDARDKQFILVDHSSYAHAIDNMAKARIVGILDHHGMGDVKSAEVIPVLSMPVGATGSLVCLCSKYKEYTAGLYHFGIGFVYATPETIAEVSAEMKQYMQEIYPQSNQDFLFCMVSDRDSTWLSWVGDGSEELVRESYEEYEGGEYIIFTPATTRKLKIIPPLMKVLEKRNEK